MNERIKKIIMPLAEDLMVVTTIFLKQNLKEKEDMSDVINLVLSAHISSLTNMMRIVSQGDKEDIKIVDKFISKLLDSMKNIHPIVGVKVNGKIN